MKKYKKIYFDHFGYGEQDVILCEFCGNVGMDLHHVKFKSQLGKDEITNLIALCRDCHNKAHSSQIFNMGLKIIVQNRQ